jgi:hypothetical protein
VSRLKRKKFYKERSMRLSTQVYEAFRDDEAKAKVLADVIEQLEAAILDTDVATRYDLNKTELTLLKEIEQNRANFTIELAKVKGELAKDIEKVRGEIKDTEVRLKIELEKVRGEIKDTEVRLRIDLTKEIEQVRADLTKEIEQVRADLTKEIEKVRADLTKEIEKVRADLSIEIAKTRADLGALISSNNVSAIRWLVGLMAAQLLAISGLIVGLFQYFFR